jgi:hypothetical protein
VSGLSGYFIYFRGTSIANRVEVNKIKTAKHKDLMMALLIALPLFFFPISFSHRNNVFTSPKTRGRPLFRKKAEDG